MFLHSGISRKKQSTSKSKISCEETLKVKRILYKCCTKSMLLNAWHWQNSGKCHSLTALSSFSNAQWIHFHLLILWIKCVWEKPWSRKETSQFIIHILKTTSCHKQLFPKYCFHKIHHFKCLGLHQNKWFPVQKLTYFWNMGTDVFVGKENTIELWKQWKNYSHHNWKPRSLQSLFLWTSLLVSTNFFAT